MAEQNLDDVDLLIDMMYKIRDILALFIENYDDMVQEYPKFKEEFGKSWPEINSNFFAVINYLQKRDNDQIVRLEKEGLTGDQLKLKFLLLQSAYDESKEKFLEFKKSTIENKPKKLSRFRRVVNFFFKHGNSILGSMADAGVPFVGVIGEFKDAAETITERAENKSHL